MSRFLQLHLLTFYHPSNLNRDDLNRPKTAMVGGVQRLRVSSQSLKRAWRTCDVFNIFGEKVGEGDRAVRTRDFRKLMFAPLVEGGFDPEKAAAWTDKVMRIYKKKSEAKDSKDKEKVKKEKKEKSLTAKDRFNFEHMLFLSAQEKAGIADVVAGLLGGKEPSDKELSKALLAKNTAVDLAMFGRMLADKPDFNVEAAVQVAHAFTVSEAAVQDDFFTAVDDLNAGIEDVGAGHMGEVEFGSGTFYLYLCVDCALLTENLAGRPEMVGPALKALTEAAATVAPTGKQNSFASRAYAQFVLAEKGDRQPRSLAAAFVKPVRVANPGGHDCDDDPSGLAIKALTDTCQKMDKAYGPLAEERASLNAHAGEGSLQELLAFVEGACL